MTTPAPSATWTTPTAVAALAASGDAAAWTWLVESHGPMVAAIATRILGRGQSADDAVQETFLALRAQARRFTPRGDDPEPSARGWIASIATSQALNLARSARRRSAREAAAAAAGADLDAAARADTEALEAIREALATLPERWSRPIALRFLAGLDYDSVATALRTTPANARVLVHRALGRLRRALAAAQLAVAGLDARLETLAQQPPADEAWRALAQRVPPAPSATPWLAVGGALATAAIAAMVTATLALRSAPAGEPAADPSLPAGAVMRLGDGRFRLADASPVIAFSPDGTRLVVGTWSPVLQVFRRDGVEERRLEGHTDSIEAVAWSGDGRRIASGSRDGTVRVWDAATGALLQVRDVGVDRPRSEGIRSVGFTDDGDQVVIARDLGDRVRCDWWSVDATGALAPVRTSESPGDAAAMVPGGTAMVSSTFDGAIRRRDGETERFWPTDAVPVPLQARRLPLAHVAVSADGSRVAAGGLLGVLASRALPDGAGSSRQLGRGQITAVALTADGRRIAAAFGEGPALLLDATTLRPLGELIGAEGSRGLAFTPDGSAIAGGEGSTVQWWDGRTGAPLGGRRGHDGFVNAVAVSPDGSLAATASHDRSVRLWRLADGAEVARLDGHEGFATSVTFSPDGRQVAGGGWQEPVRVWDVASGKLVRTIAGSVGDVRWLGDGSLLCGEGGDGREASVRHLRADGTLLASGLAADDAGLRCWTVSRDGRTLLSAPQGVITNDVLMEGPGSGVVVSSADAPAARADIAVHDLATGDRAGSIPGHPFMVAHLAISPDGNRVASVGFQGGRRVHDRAAGRALWETAGDGPVTFSPDGALLACGDDQGIALVDAATGRVLGARTDAHAAQVSDVAFTPDGTRVLTASWDSTVLVWDVAALRAGR